MAKIEDQRIVIDCTCEVQLQQTIIDAVYLALKLEKEICFFGNYLNTSEKEHLQQRTAFYANFVKKDIPSLPVSVLLLEGKLNKLVKELGEKYNTILYCYSGAMDNRLLEAFYRSGFPFYFSKKQEGIRAVPSKLGIWFLMISFGASFGYTVMARISLLIGRLEFLLKDWLHIIK